MSDWSKLGSVGNEAVPAWGVAAMKATLEAFEDARAERDELEARVARLEVEYDHLRRCQITIENIVLQEPAEPLEPRGPHD